MACLDMYNSEQQKGHLVSMSPRISFSNDFVDAQLSLKQEIIRSSKSQVPPISSSDFEFSVSNYSMISADELFSKGRILPFRDTNSNNHTHRTTTLKQELLLVDHDYDDVSSQPKGTWKEFLGLKRTHIASKKPEQKNQKSSTEASSQVDVHRSFGNLVHEKAHINKSSQEGLITEI